MDEDLSDKAIVDGPGGEPGIIISSARERE